jgi:predicted RNA-binding Zn-ribbon protein involved in translation (DUF1610 family)
MCIKPKPFVYNCPSCGWKKVVSPKSDVLMPGEYFKDCPKCGASPLKREETNLIVGLGLSLLNLFPKF